MADFGTKFKDKTGLYTYLEKSYDVQEEPEVKVEDNKPVVESKLPPQSQELLKFIFNDDHFQTTMRQMGYVS
jgi:hypothetical protein